MLSVKILIFNPEKMANAIILYFKTRYSKATSPISPPNRSRFSTQNQ